MGDGMVVHLRRAAILFYAGLVKLANTWDLKSHDVKVLSVRLRYPALYPQAEMPVGFIF